jgi:hypothetical protein
MERMMRKGYLRENAYFLLQSKRISEEMKSLKKEKTSPGSSGKPSSSNTDGSSTTKK